MSQIVLAKHGFVVSDDDRKNHRFPSLTFSPGSHPLHRRRLVRRASQPHRRPNLLEGNIATVSVVAVCRVGHIK
ncbi:hypothetical protein, partial [Corynebacterium sp. HMSC078H07]|uniref:hypothetical protein n=1 Tax=Corynebacterium sp. HMSC078H07 TaxID=1739379 RepID=UPI001AEFC263